MALLDKDDKVDEETQANSVALCNLIAGGGVSSSLEAGVLLKLVGYTSQLTELYR